jgi:multidrug efflux system membrane fusion protein
VQQNGQASFVYVLKDGKAKLQPIQVGVTTGTTAQVTGIDPGDVLATSSFDKLQDGTAVTISQGDAGGGGSGGGQGGKGKGKGKGGAAAGSSAASGSNGSSAP